MRVSKREKLTFVALWALCTFVIFEFVGCTPSSQGETAEEVAQEEGEKRIGAEPAYGEQPNLLPPMRPSYRVANPQLI